MRWVTPLGVAVILALVGCGSSDDSGNAGNGGSHSGGTGGGGKGGTGGGGKGGAGQGGSGGGAQGGTSAGGSGGSAQGGTSGSGAGAKFDHMVIILMENHGYDQIYGTATWMTSFADQNASLQQYTAIDHPSEPNYIATFGGSTFGTSSDGNCCYQLDHPNLVDQLESKGLTWKAFAEAADNSGQCSFDPPRSGDHYPFIDYKDMNVAARCANMLTTSDSTDDEVIAELNRDDAANFVWLTPTDDHNMHDNSVSSGDTYLKGLVTKILATKTFTSTRAALFITYDEGNNDAPSDFVYSVWSGPVVKTGLKSTNSYDHYSILATVEANWGISPLPSPANDGSANAMMEVFK